MKNPKFWQTKTFQEIEKHWHDKLKESGFKDQEEILNGNYILKQRASNCFRSLRQVEREARQEYYSQMGFQAGQETFSDAIEQLVMERRSMGVKIKDICQELRALNERCHRYTIYRIIHKYEVKWGLKKKK